MRGVTTTRGRPTRWSGRCSGWSTPAPARSGAARSARTSATGRPARRASSGGAAATRSPGGWPGCSRRTPCSGRGSCADWEAGVDSDGVGARHSTPTCSGSPSSGDGWWRPSARPARSVRHARVLDELRAGPQALDLPARLSLFGHTRLAVTEVELLAALGEHRDVHLWLPHPSAALWRLADRRWPGPCRAATTPPTCRSATRCSRRSAATCASCERTLLVRVPTVEPVETEPSTRSSRPTVPSHAVLLSWLQADIAANATVDPAGRVLDVDDRSVQVHACHGPARQVEVLREVLLGLLADDPTLEPRDILVMCPDIEAYAPLVEAAFGLGEAVAGGHPGQQPAGAARRPRADADQPAARGASARCSTSPAAAPRRAGCSTCSRPSRCAGGSASPTTTSRRSPAGSSRPASGGPSTQSTGRRSGSTATSRTPGASVSTGCSPGWRCPTTPTRLARHDPAARRRRHRPASTSPAGSPSASTGCSAVTDRLDRQPPRRPLARRPRRGRRRR